MIGRDGGVGSTPRERPAAAPDGSRRCRAGAEVEAARHRPRRPESGTADRCHPILPGARPRRTADRSGFWTPAAELYCLVGMARLPRPARWHRSTRRITRLYHPLLYFNGRPAELKEKCACEVRSPHDAGPIYLESMAQTDRVEIPNQSLFRQAEVCEIASVQPYVLRSWEAEFPDLGVSKSQGAPRVYRREDVERVLRIKHLLFAEGLTLAGARRKLQEERPAGCRRAGDDVAGRAARQGRARADRAGQAGAPLAGRDAVTPPWRQRAGRPGSSSSRRRAPRRRLPRCGRRPPRRRWRKARKKR